MCVYIKNKFYLLKKIKKKTKKKYLQYIPAIQENDNNECRAYLNREMWHFGKLRNVYFFILN